MISYDINIEYPITIDGVDSITLNDQFDTGVLHQFDMFRWWQYRTLQLQVVGAYTSFTVSALETSQTIRFTLLPESKTDQIELMMESDIVVLVPKKDLFGLVTRKIKDYITFERLTLAEAKEYMTLFVNQDVSLLEDIYKQSLQKLKMRT